MFLYLKSRRHTLLSKSLVLLFFSLFCNGATAGVEDLIDVGQSQEQSAVLSFIEEETINAATGFTRPTFSSSGNVFVLTKEEIRQAQIRSLVDIFRLVPGLDVFHNSSDGFNLAANGLGSQFCNLLLVLMDGAPVITVRYGETPWSGLPVSPEDIERVEVVLGPGTSLYGENAFSGVIDIITRTPESRSKNGGELNLTKGSLGFGRANFRANSNSSKASLSIRGGTEVSDGLTQRSQLPGIADKQSSTLDERQQWIDVSYKRQLDKYRSLDLELAFSESLSGGRDVLDGKAQNGDNRLFFGVTRYTEQINPEQEFRLRVNVMNKRDSKKTGPGADEESVYADPYSEELVDLDLRKLVDYRKLRSIFGASFRGKKGHGQPLDGRHEADTRSIYYQAEYDFDDNWSSFASLRLFDHSITDRDSSWKFDLRRRLGEREIVRIGSGTAIRFPDLSNLYLLPTENLDGVPLSTPPPCEPRRFGKRGNPLHYLGL